MSTIQFEGRRISEIAQEINDRLKGDGIEPEEYGFGDRSDLDGGPKVLDSYLRSIVCYPVRGGSEGHYVHLATISHFGDASAQRHRVISLAKTYSADNAWAIARAVARYLDI